MASARSASLYGGPGAEPVVGGQGAEPPEAESFSAFELPTEQQNLPRFPYSAVFRSSDNLLLGIHNTAPKLLALLH